MKTCSSASWRLERVTRGSTQTTRTPWSLARLRYCKVPVPNVPSPGLQPHMTMSRELT